MIIVVSGPPSPIMENQHEFVAEMVPNTPFNFSFDPTTEDSDTSAGFLDADTHSIAGSVKSMGSQNSEDSLYNRVWSQYLTLRDAYQHIDNILSIKIRKFSGEENMEIFEQFIRSIRTEAAYYDLSEDVKIKLALDNLTGKAKKWKERLPVYEWSTLDEFKDDLRKQCQIINAHSTWNLDFLDLIQMGTLKGYTKRFKKLKDRVDSSVYNASILRDKYIAGLEEPLRTLVRVNEPSSWQDARDFAYQEDYKNKQKEKAIYSRGTNRTYKYSRR